MIHYTLLPKNEMKMLRREYRVRLFVIALFFVSTGIVIGIAALIPTYLYTEQQVKEASRNRALLEENRKANGALQIERDLLKSQTIAEKILSEVGSAPYSEILERIISHRPKDILLSSFIFSDVTSSATSTQTEIQLRGKAISRETLLAFKKRLESDVAFTVVELPLSDLAKSKAIGFSVRLVAQTIK